MKRLGIVLFSLILTFSIVAIASAAKKPMMYVGQFDVTGNVIRHAQGGSLLDPDLRPELYADFSDSCGGGTCSPNISGFSAIPVIADILLDGVLVKRVLWQFTASVVDGQVDMVNGYGSINEYVDIMNSGEHVISAKAYPFTGNMSPSGSHYYYYYEEKVDIAPVSVYPAVLTMPDGMVAVRMLLSPMSDVSLAVGDPIKIGIGGGEITLPVLEEYGVLYVEVLVPSEVYASIQGGNLALTFTVGSRTFTANLWFDSPVSY